MPKNSPSRSGGERRTMNPRSATWTPPSPEPRIAPAPTNRVMPSTDGTGSPAASTPLNEIEPAPRTSPTAQLVSTAISVLRGPTRSHSHDAHDHDRGVDRARVEEPPEEEARHPGPLPRVLDRDAELTPRADGCG